MSYMRHDSQLLFDRFIISMQSDAAFTGGADVGDANIGCGFFQTRVHSSDRGQYSGSIL
jgi:hypothetical protein